VVDQERPRSPGAYRYARVYEALPMHGDVHLEADARREVAGTPLEDADGLHARPLGYAS
jgi:hypothetical protein